MMKALLYVNILSSYHGEVAYVDDHGLVDVPQPVLQPQAHVQHGDQEALHHRRQELAEGQEEEVEVDRERKASKGTPKKDTRDCSPIHRQMKWLLLM